MDSFARNNDDLIGRVRIIPGDISADDHSQLDKDATSLSNLAFESMAGDILYFVISASVSSYAKTNWPINVNITNVEACKTLLSSNPEMRPLLEQAHRSGRYSEIRRRVEFHIAAKRNVTPQESAFGIDVIDQRINKQLDSLRGVIETFLKNPELPTWVPPHWVTPSNREFLTNLQMPSYRNGNPSLLFHNLGKSDHKELEGILASGGHAFICNASGSGKTQCLLDLLVKYWGFYIVAVPDVNGVGVRDLQDALAGVTDYYDWHSDLTPVPPEERRRQNDVNINIASKLLRKVLAARIVVFRLFLELAIQVDGKLQEKHKRAWLLFQLSDQVGPLQGRSHPFVQIIGNSLVRASNEALNILIRRLEEYMPEPLFIFGLDEAQRAARLYPHAFISSSDPSMFRSILREIVRIFTESPIKLIVSGTGLSLAEIEDAIASGVSKPAEYVKLFHQLGMFDSWPKLIQFLERYIPASILESPSGYRLQRRMREYLLGRYRFSTSFLEYFLRNGLESPHTLLNEYIKGHTDRYPGDTGLPFSSAEPKLHFEVRMLGFEWTRLQSDTGALQDASQIVQSHLTRGIFPTFGPVTARLVEYGIARLRQGHTGEIVESLAFLSLMQWLETRQHVNLKANIQSRLGYPESRGHAYEEVVILYLLRQLRYPTPLSTIFDFHGTLPPWANAKAEIVGRLNSTNVSVDVLGDAPQNPGLGVVHYAANLEGVLDWVDNPHTAPAILIPGQCFGPDVMIRCWLESVGTVFLMGQCKSFTTGNKESLDASTNSHALTALTPSHWFKGTKEKNRRQKLITTIEKHKILRFVAGYPLPPDLDSSALSVVKARDELGPNVPLASINVDMFKSHFYSESEATSLLVPMEHALSRKRNASEMDG